MRMVHSLWLPVNGWRGNGRLSPPIRRMSYNIQLSRGEGSDQLMGSITVVDKNTIQLKPEGEPAAVLVRVKDDDEGDGDVRAKLVGSWIGDVETTLNGAEGELDDSMKEMMSTMVGGMSVDIAKDGTYTLHNEGQDDVEGTWSIETNDDGENILTAEPDTGEETLVFVVEFHDGDLVSMNPSDGPAVYFKRKK